MDDLKELLDEFEADINSGRLTGDLALEFIGDANRIIEIIDQDLIIQMERQND